MSALRPASLAVLLALSPGGCGDDVPDAQIMGTLGMGDDGGAASTTGPDDDGAQIDLVIDRADRSINLCEMKFAESEFVIDKAYARELARKRDVFRNITGTKKAVFLTLVTTYGVRSNDHAQRLGVQSVTMDALFAR